MGTVELSFVVPAYDEEEFIEATLLSIDEVAKGEVPYEIVVVDDGSKDKTFEKALLFSKRNGHVKVLRSFKNVGKGHAVKNGFMQAAGDIVIFADSDMEIDLGTISRYVEALEDCDIAIGSKWHPDSMVNMSLSRRFLSHGFNFFVRLFTGVRLKDTQVGLKAIRRNVFADVFPRLAVKRYAFDVELLTVAKLYNLKVVELPVNIRLKRSFKIRELMRMFIDLLGIAYRLRIIRWYEQSFNLD